VNVRFIFLLDEAQRILGDRFPRGIQDNLFALLYGDMLEPARRIGMIFAGAQDLYRFSEDETSPIGSRAGRHLLESLDRSAVDDIVHTLIARHGWQGDTGIADWVFEQAGGQAGLTVRLTEDLMFTHDVEATKLQCSQKQIHLLRMWALSLSPEARCLHDFLLTRTQASKREIALYLRENAFDPFNADRAIEELRFTGIAHALNTTAEAIQRICVIYWNYADTFGGDSGNSAGELEVWRLIERTELKLRSVIRDVYIAKWPIAYLDKMKQVLGEVAWATICKVQEKSSNAYMLSPIRSTRDHLDCMYIDDLKRLLISPLVWDSFTRLFRDKRHVEDLIASITPVRNDRAHFAKVPPKELDRCRIACDDLLVIFERG